MFHFSFSTGKLPSRLAWCIAHLVVCSGLLAQAPRSAGLYLGFPIIPERLSEQQEYQPFQVLPYFGFADLLKGARNDLFVYAEPQFVVAQVSYASSGETEFGLNLGLEYRFNFTERASLTAAVGSGPHYITVETAKQARGFAFSDNLTLGLRRGLRNSGIDMHLKWRFRHISNGSLRRPNGGINTWFLLLGFTRTLG